MHVLLLNSVVIGYRHCKQLIFGTHVNCLADRISAAWKIAINWFCHRHVDVFSDRDMIVLCLALNRHFVSMTDRRLLGHHHVVRIVKPDCRFLWKTKGTGRHDRNKRRRQKQADWSKTCTVLLHSVNHPWNWNKVVAFIVEVLVFSEHLQKDDRKCDENQVSSDYDKNYGQHKARYGIHRSLHSDCNRIPWSKCDDADDSEDPWAARFFFSLIRCLPQVKRVDRA